MKKYCKIWALSFLILPSSVFAEIRSGNDTHDHDVIEIPQSVQMFVNMSRNGEVPHKAESLVQECMEKYSSQGMEKVFECVDAPAQGGAGHALSRGVLYDEDSHEKKDYVPSSFDGQKGRERDVKSFYEPVKSVHEDKVYCQDVVMTKEQKEKGDKQDECR